LTPRKFKNRRHKTTANIKNKTAMNTFRKLVMAAGLMLAVCSHAATIPVWPNHLGIGGADGDTTHFAGKGAVQAAMASSGRVTNTAWFATSAKPGGVPRVTFLDVTSDRTGEEGVEFWGTTNTLSITSTNSANTNQVTVSATNGLVAVGSACVIQTLGSAGTTDGLQFLTVSNLSGTIVQFYQTITNAVNPGDKLFVMERRGKLLFTVGQGNLGADGYTNIVVKNKQFTAPANSALFTGDEGKPLMITLTASNAIAAINAINGEYWKRPRP
jgi:hypothetical protein